MLNLIKVFVCDYSGEYPAAYLATLNATYADDIAGYIAATTNVQPYLYEAPHLVCWQEEHWLYVAMALLVLITYYPMASLLFPNLQFVDESLDVKFEPSFLIIIAQGKLFLAGIMAVFVETPLTKVLAAIAVYGFFTIQNMLQQPCLVKRINSWSTLRFFVPLAICGSTAELLLSDGQNVTTALIIMAGSAGIGCLATVLFHTFRWGWRSTNIEAMGEGLIQQDKKHHHADDELIYDDDLVSYKGTTSSRRKKDVKEQKKGVHHHAMEDLEDFAEVQAKKEK
jgi:hypothetical protein